MLLRRQTPNCLAKSEGVLLQSVSCLYQGWWSSAVDWPSRAASMDPRCQGQQVRARRGPRRTGWKCDDGSETAAQRGMRCGMLVDGGLSDGVCMGNRAPMALRLTISTVFTVAVAREKACLDAIMLGLSLVRLLGVKPSVLGWCAGGLTAPRSRDSIIGIIETRRAGDGWRGSSPRYRSVSSRALQLSACNAHHSLSLLASIWRRARASV
jgi:hypothetical protein